LNRILTYLKSYLTSRLNIEHREEQSTFPVFNPQSLADSPLKSFITQNQLNDEELVMLFMALVPHIAPQFFNNIIAQFLPDGGDFPEFGGIKGKNHRGILPTGETVLYILGGNDVEERNKLLYLFDETHLFTKKNVLYLDSVPAGEPKLSGKLILDDEYRELFIRGRVSRPKLSTDFPAQFIETEMEWSNLVLPDITLEEINELEIWLKYDEQLIADWKLQGKVKPGYRVLFHGPSGTGKTLTACLLGKYTGRDVYRIDLSMVVSKYIGETEKNLGKLFDKAKNKDWILFFDEADALFGKRTNVRDAHDKYANQEVSYLLQRIEMYPGLVILASNFKTNIDKAFTRRFNAFIHFPFPGSDERERLWKNYLPSHVELDQVIELSKIARKYELNGANIVNVIQYVGLKTLEKQSDKITNADLLAGIRKEYRKEGKLLKK